ncbi:MAG: 50S ribosomal protein L11 methyltransferase [Minwuiales bacterium]|nr:50S ribosomal protein L11 methyltransferase [Minwuiales bacterium]
MSTPPEQRATYWQATVIAPRDRLGAVEAVLEAGALSFADFEIPNSAHRRLEALYDAPPDREALSAALGGLPVEIAAIEDRDWVSESQRLNEPIRAGRFYVRGSHHPPHAAASLLDIVVDAGLAFGTGRHETTFGCLLVLDRLAKGRRFRRPLDLGCGSGVLAMAMARAWGCRVLAADIDPAAVAVTRENAHRNRLALLIHAVRADGVGHRDLMAPARHDLIVANILARPLAKLARPVARSLTPGGVLVLSGLLEGQEAMVRNAYRVQGLRLCGRIALSGWLTLLMIR